MFWNEFGTEIGTSIELRQQRNAIGKLQNHVSRRASLGRANRQSVTEQVGWREEWWKKVRSWKIYGTGPIPELCRAFEAAMILIAPGSILKVS